MDNEQWLTERPGKNSPWRTAVVKLSNWVDLEWIKPISIGEALPGQLSVSRPGTIAAAQVNYYDESPIIMISMYGLWDKPHSLTSRSWIYADASVHGVISDLSIFIGSQSNHRIIASGDLNVLFGYGEHGSKYWAERYATIFSRFQSLGMRFVGPQSPNGRQAKPWPSELPHSSKNVPTYYTNHQNPTTATRQLDFVFASESIADKVRATALNQPDGWGPSDHCRIMIEIE